MEKKRKVELRIVWYLRGKETRGLEGSLVVDICFRSGKYLRGGGWGGFACQSLGSRNE